VAEGLENLAESGREKENNQKNLPSRRGKRKQKKKLTYWHMENFLSNTNVRYLNVGHHEKVSFLSQKGKENIEPSQK